MQSESSFTLVARWLAIAGFGAVPASAEPTPAP